MKIVNCRTDHIPSPIGFQMDTPVFTWVTENAVGKKQAAAYVRIAADPEMTLILAETTEPEKVSSLGTPVPIKLAPRTRYYWDVTVVSDDGESASSDVQFFETGKTDEPWEGKWIGCDETEERHPVFRKTFPSRGNVRKARLYICGLGLYHAAINGKPVTEERMTPYCTVYEKWVQAQTYDVTNWITSGENRIEVTLGNGWYMGRISSGFYGDRHRLIAELRVTYEDGSEEVVATDGSWTVGRSTITFSDIYDGEHRDDTLPPVEAVPAIELAESEDWGERMKNGEPVCRPLHLTDRLSIPVLAHEELSPVELIETPAGEKVFDIGQNLGGTFRLSVHEPAGTKIHVQFGEVLQNGCFYRDNLRTALAEYWYISNGNLVELEPLFTWYGFRYVKVEGIPDLKKESFTAIALYSDVTPIGSFESGDVKLNKLMNNISWGQKSNFLDVPTDCPQRDERRGWTADTQVFVPTASYLTDSFAFYRKYLEDLALDQQNYDGMVPDFVPSNGYEHCSSVWGDAATIIPWALYQYSGDQTILARQYDSMKAWVDYIHRLDGDGHAWREHIHYGDWLALDHPHQSPSEMRGGTEEGYIADIFYMNSARIVAKSAALLGKEDDAAKYTELADHIKKELQAEYFTPRGRCSVQTMTGYTLALFFDLTTDRQKTLNQLVDLLKNKDNKFVTGFVGTPMVPRVLSAEGLDKLAYTIIHDERYPGWLYEINLGATTIWERWNSLDENGMVSSTGMNSFNHYAYGAIGEWMWQTMAGISPDPSAPGFQHAILRPVPDAATGTMKASFASAAGTYRTEWKVLPGNRVYIKVEVPFNASATLILPYAKEEAVRELNAGVYEYTYDLAEPLMRRLNAFSPIGELMEDKKASEILREVFPGANQIPPSLWNMTLGGMLQEFGVEGSKAISEALDLALSAMYEE